MIWVFSIAFILFWSLAHAAEASSGIEWTALLMTVIGGLALFLFGMEKMSRGMKKAAGDGMRDIMSALTRNQFVGLFVGALVTMVIQSSSATTVMLVSFVQAQLMTLTQSLGVILGAGIGATVTAQLVAFKLTDYALLMIAIGFAMTLFGRKESTKYFGETLFGFGILFFGMKLMSDAMVPLRTYEPFLKVLKGLENPWMGLLFGCVFTALIQSSSAFTGIMIVLAQQGLLSLEAGIPLILGTNVGTTITAILASMGASRDAKRVALAHFLFRVAGVLVFAFWIPYFAELVRWFSPEGHGVGLERLATEAPRQIANAHTFFNVSSAFLALPFLKPFHKLLHVLLPKRENEHVMVQTTKYLRDSALATPAVAIKLARSEISRMAGTLKGMLESVIVPFQTNERHPDPWYPHMTVVEAIVFREEKVDFLEKSIVEYLRNIGRQEIAKEQIKEVYAMMSIVNDMESIGDVIQKNMIPLIRKKRLLNTDFSEEGKNELIAFHTKIVKQMARLDDAFKGMDMEIAEKVMSKEEKYSDLEIDFRKRHLRRLQDEMEASIETHEIHMELMDLLKQINAYAAHIAQTIQYIGEKRESTQNKVAV